MRRLQTGAQAASLPHNLRIFSRFRHFLYVKVFYRRKLPHLHVIGRPLFLTWRLHGSLPQGRAFPPQFTGGQAFVAMDRLLDEARSGPFFLRQPQIAKMVAAAIQQCAQSMYELHAWVLMPNHVHLLITPGIEVPKITKSLKWFTAREANKNLRRTGPFWQDESYDRLVRDSKEFERIRAYIEVNPVRAGLANSPEEYPWSSATGAGL